MTTRVESSIRRRNLLVASLLLLAWGAAHGEIYRWRDPGGEVHYGDRPPVGVVADRVRVRPAPSSLTPEQAAARIEALRSARASAGADQRAAARRAAEAADAADEEARRARCDAARWALAALETQRPVYRDERGAFRVKRPPPQADVYGGERHYLEDAERAGEIAHFREQQAEACAGFPGATDKALAEAELRQAEQCEFALFELERLRRPEARASREDLARREEFLRKHCW